MKIREKDLIFLKNYLLCVILSIGFTLEKNGLFVSSSNKYSRVCLQTKRYFETP